MSEAVTYTVHDGVAVIAMNNPPVNGLGSVLRPGIMDGLQKAAADPAKTPAAQPRSIIHPNRGAPSVKPTSKPA